MGCIISGGKTLSVSVSNRREVDVHYLDDGANVFPAPGKPGQAVTDNRGHRESSFRPFVSPLRCFPSRVEEFFECQNCLLAQIRLVNPPFPHSPPHFILPLKVSIHHV